jgi:hypothetical protein
MTANLHIVIDYTFQTEEDNQRHYIIKTILAILELCSTLSRFVMTSHEFT